MENHCKLILISQMYLYKCTERVEVCLQINKMIQICVSIYSILWNGNIDEKVYWKLVELSSQIYHNLLNFPPIVLYLSLIYLYQIKSLSLLIDMQ